MELCAGAVDRGGPFGGFRGELHPPDLAVFNGPSWLLDFDAGYPRNAAGRDGVAAVRWCDLHRPHDQGPPFTADVAAPQLEVGEVRRDPEPHTRATHNHDHMSNNCSKEEVRSLRSRFAANALSWLTHSHSR